MRLASRSTHLGLVSGVHVCLSVDEQFHQLLVTPCSCTIHWCPQYGIPERGNKRRGREGVGREGGRERKGGGKEGRKD